MNEIIKLILSLIGLSKKAAKPKKKAASPTFSAAGASGPKKPTSPTPVKLAQVSTPAPVQAVICQTCGIALDSSLWFCRTCGSRTALPEPVFSSASVDQKKVSDFKYMKQDAEKKEKEFAALNIKKEGDFLYKVNENSVSITGFTKLNTSVQIPAQINGLTVTEIGERAFSNKGITSVTIPSGLTCIGEYAFSKNALTAITIPGSVKTVGKFAFANNTFTSIVLEEGVQSVGECAFEKQTKFHEDVSTVPHITIPGSMKNIENEAFARSRIGSVTFSSGLKTIGEKAFMCNQFKSVVIPDGVTEIGKNAFDENFLESVTFPDSLVKIGDSAFYSSKLTSVTLPSKLKTLGDDAFYNNKIKEISIPGTVKKIGNAAFHKNEIACITIGEGVETIGKRAFKENKLESVRDIPLPSSLTIIGEEAFYMNNIAGDIIFPEALTKIGKRAFSDNKLTGIVLRGKTELDEYAFASNEISRLIIGSRMPSAGDRSFDGNKALQGVTIPQNVKVAGDDLPAATAPFASSVYLFRGDTDNLKLEDSAYWADFDQKIIADKEIKKLKLPAVCYDAAGAKIGVIDRDIVKGGIVVFNAKYREYIARMFFARTSYYLNLGIPFGYFTLDRGDVYQYNGGMVTTDGIVLRDFNKKFIEDDKGVIKSSGKDEAEKFILGTVKVEGETGIAFDKNGVKVGEVRECGVNALIFAAAMLRFIFNDR